MKRPQHRKNKAHQKEAEPLNVDERNLIDADESAEIAIEDRISMYWLENKGFVITCIAILVFVIVGFNGTRIYKDYALQKQVSEYQAAAEAEDLETFADSHSTLKLGSFAALKVADQAFEAGEFEKALQFYTQAQQNLTETPLAGRAQLGAAFSQFKLEDAAAATEILEALAANPTASESIRAEAAYYLAVSAFSEKRIEDFNAYTEQVNGFTQAIQLQQRLASYAQQLQ